MCRSVAVGWLVQLIMLATPTSAGQAAVLVTYSTECKFLIVGLFGQICKPHHNDLAGGL